MSILARSPKLGYLYIVYQRARAKDRKEHAVAIS